MQSTKYFKGQQISGDKHANALGTGGVTMRSLASALPPGISWAADTFLMTAVRDTVAVN